MSETRDDAATIANVRAELTARAKEMQSARDTLIWIRDELEDEGDRGRHTERMAQARIRG